MPRCAEISLSVLRSQRPGLPVWYRARGLRERWGVGQAEQQHPLGPLVPAPGVRPGYLRCFPSLVIGDFCCSDLPVPTGKKQKDFFFNLLRESVS